MSKEDLTVPPTALAVAVLMLVPLTGEYADGDTPTASAQALFEQTCSQCHPAARATERSRSREEWQAIVTRMREHARETDTAIARETAETIVAFLARGDAAPGVSPSAPGHTHAEEHGRGAGELGEALGITTAALVLCMIASGLLRRKLRRRFGPLHAAMAVLLAAAVLAHGTILYLHTGFPRSLWHLSGSAGLLALLATAGAGLLRRRLRRRFLKLHMAGATCSAAMVLSRVPCIFVHSPPASARQLSGNWMNTWVASCASRPAMGPVESSSPSASSCSSYTRRH